jgi:ABC-2 type transport system permease protein
MDFVSSPFKIYGLLYRARRRQMWNRFAETYREAKFMFYFIACFVVGYWFLFTFLFYQGLHFVQFGIPGLGDLLLSRLLYILFALMFGMLVTSSAIVGYGVFFKNQETAWLQTLPVSHGQIFRWKFFEMALLASWAFIFLSGPLILAYAIVLKISPLFLLGVVVLYLPFSFLANAIGAAAILLLVLLWHHVWGRRFILISLCFLVVFGYLNFKPIDVHALKEAQTVPLINILLRNTQLAAKPLMPSYWLASAVIGLGERLWTKAIFFYGVTLSYSLFFCWILLNYSGNWFYTDFSHVQDRRLHHREKRRGELLPLFFLGKILFCWMRWLKRPIRSILVKDFVTFFRDTAQWSQFAIFFGLLGFYFLNIRNFRYELDERFWVSVIAFLNLASLGLILSTLTTRFVFPQFSLEGKRLWLIGLSPITLKEVVWGKFWASAIASGAITIGLMQFSFKSLHLEPAMQQIIAFTIFMMSLGLNGIAVGMGVIFPNLRQTNAAQIVSGVGGTFCLVCSLGYVAVTVLGVAIPMHFRYMAKASIDFDFASPVGMIYIGVFLISLIAMMLPMRFAEKKLLNLEI